MARETLQQRICIPEKKRREGNKEFTFGHIYFEVLVEQIIGDMATEIMGLKSHEGSRLNIIWD